MVARRMPHMQIEEIMQNKYNIGTSVYLVYNNGLSYFVTKDKLIVSKISCDEIGYHYSLRNEHDDPIDWCYEDDLFLDYFEAQSEVLKKNSLRGVKK